jgi:RecA/RadA recombinase
MGLQRRSKEESQDATRKIEKAKPKTEDAYVSIDKDTLLISTGSTLLDLAISGGRVRGGGIPGGIMVEIFGPSGSGKCVIGETNTITNRKLCEIKEHSNGISGFGEKEIMTVSDSGEEKTSHFYEEEADTLVKIKNYLGMELTGTPEHPILCWENNKIKFKTLGSIQEGDLTCIPRELNNFPKYNQALNFVDITKQLPSTKHVENVPKQMDKELSRLLGYLVANGCRRGESISMSSKNEEIRKDVINICTSLRVKCGKLEKEKDFYVGRTAFCRFIDYLYGKDFPKSRGKEVPEKVLSSSRECQRQFLLSLFDCDSWCDEVAVFEYYTASKKLAEQVQIMLQNFGILTIHGYKYLEKYDHTYHTLTVPGFLFKKFAELFNDSIKYNMRPKERYWTANQLPIKDTLRDLVEDIREELSVGSNGIYSVVGESKRFQLLKGVPDYFSKSKNNYPAEHVPKILENLKELPQQGSVLLLKKVLESLVPFYLAKVVFKAWIKEPTMVYDFTIPKTHKFFTNGYISHNTALVTEVAGAAQDKGGDVFFVDPEARIDKEYSKIYGFEMTKENYARPDTVTETFQLIEEWAPANEKAINVFAADSIAALSTNMEMSVDGDKRGQRKAKELSEGCRKTARLIAHNNKLILFTNQERDGEFGKTTPGGHAIPYHCSLRLRVIRKGRIEKKKKITSGVEVKKTIGIESEVLVKKSTVDDEYRTAPLYIIFGVGIDDVRANLQYVKDMMKKTKYQCVDQEWATMDKAIAYIEENDLEPQLREMVIDIWEEVEAKFHMDRKAKKRF